MKVILVMLAGLVMTACAANEPNQSTEAARERARVHTELGAGYYAQNQIAVALEEFQDAARIDPTYAPAQNGLGLVYGTLREDVKADTAFKKALQLEPNSSETRNNYGSFLCSRNRIDESIIQFSEAVKNPLYVTPGVAYMNAGTCLLRKRDTKNAELYLQHALQIQPQLFQAGYQLAVIAYGRGQYDMARNYLRAGLESNSPTPEMLWLGIQLERQLGNRDAEASYALQLRRKYPNSEQTKLLLSGQ
ncbi:type IV pilus biogenesis/stability protein PilW [Methylobacillus gramineus]|uniref:type IV pilus biogenesis/stability protein PilW n=1 Tax=Methylobacillus gramineus TaxID=755169 RepID=UPI001CFF8CBC|nr:type IV pilus biogenesis/stability protein PilW [Methylobacillus gramineus]MCB5184146.1 type IV pilus biogenesis/stability protein PilW [Methylobacillus gramineus]